MDIRQRHAFCDSGMQTYKNTLGWWTQEDRDSKDARWYKHRKEPMKRMGAMKKITDNVKKKKW